MGSTQCSSSRYQTPWPSVDEHWLAPPGRWKVCDLQDRTARHLRFEHPANPAEVALRFARAVDRQGVASQGSTDGCAWWWVLIVREDLSERWIAVVRARGRQRVVWACWSTKRWRGW